MKFNWKYYENGVISRNSVTIASTTSQSNFLFPTPSLLPPHPITFPTWSIQVVFGEGLWKCKRVSWHSRNTQKVSNIILALTNPCSLPARNRQSHKYINNRQPSLTMLTHLTKTFLFFWSILTLAIFDLTTAKERKWRFDALKINDQLASRGSKIISFLEKIIHSLISTCILTWVAWLHFQSSRHMYKKSSENMWVYISYSQW